MSRPYGLSMMEAVARTGEILGDIFQSYKPRQPSEAFPFREVLPRVAHLLHRKLEKLNYWYIYSESIASQPWSFLPMDEMAEAEVIWLRHLETLWSKHFGSTKMYGLAKIVVPKEAANLPEGFYRSYSFGGVAQTEYVIFVVKQGQTIGEAYEPSNFYVRPSRSSDFGQMRAEEFRLFMIGLVIELIRLVSKSFQDSELWKKLGDLFSSDNVQQD